MNSQFDINDAVGWTSVVMQLIFVIMGWFFLGGWLGWLFANCIFLILIILTVMDISNFINKFDWEDED